MIGLDELNEFNRGSKPTWEEEVWYAFWEKGISYEEFERLPIPYILSILKVNNHYAKEMEKRSKRK